MEGTEEKTTRIVLLGKTGSGKSSLANTLCGEELFSTSFSPNSETNVCQPEPRNINGRKIELIDTPGFFDTNPNSNKESPEFLKCMEKCGPGPHAFLLVLKVEKYTVLEKATVALMLKYFSEEALKYTTVVFTYGDQLEGKKNIKEWVEESETLNNLVKKCGGRCCVVDNKYWNNQLQIEQLLQTIDQTVKENGGRCYTNEMMMMMMRMSDTKQETKWKSVAVGILVGAFLGAITGGGVAYYMGLSCAKVCLSGAGGAVAGGLIGWGAQKALKPGTASPPTEEQKKTKAYMDEVTRLFKEIQMHLGI